MLETTLCGVKMKNPVIAASGTFGFGLEYAEYMDLNQVGGIAVKGLTYEARTGNTGRRICETPSGVLNGIGLENPGVHAFINDILPQLRQYDVPIMVNISGNEIEDYGKMATELDIPGVDWVEVNISCPNVKNGCLAFGVEEASAAAVTEMVKKHTRKPVIVKLSPNVTDIAAIAKTVEDSGADGISLINTLLGMVIDVDNWKPVMGNVMAGLSGPAIKPIAVRMVYQVAQAVRIPVLGMGGIMTGRDAAEFMLAGATAVGVGTATLINPQAVANIARELKEYGEARGLSGVSSLVGAMMK